MALERGRTHTVKANWQGRGSVISGALFGRRRRQLSYWANHWSQWRIRDALNFYYLESKKPPSKQVKVCVFSGCWLQGQDLNLAAHPNKITLRCLHPSITRPRSEPQVRRTYAPPPQPYSIEISQPLPVTPFRCPRGASREALTERRCPRITAHGCYPDCYPK